MNTEYSDVIDSFLNGQFKQMNNQFLEVDSYDFVDELQNDETLNDKQKISILGKLLKNS